MTSKWLSSQGAVSRVSQLLGQAGIPLELKVGKICSSFARLFFNSTITGVDALETITYAPMDAEAEFREIDQLVSIHRTLEISDKWDFDIVAHCPIECKHRKDVDLFAFPLDKFKVN